MGKNTCTLKSKMLRRKSHRKELGAPAITHVYLLHACMYPFTLSFSVELMKANTAYEEKHQARNAPEKVVLELLWDITTLRKLNEEGRTLRTEILISHDHLDQPQFARFEFNLQRKLSGIRTHLQEVVKGVFRFSCYAHFCLDD